MKVKLSTLIDGFDMKPDMCDSFLDKETGEVHFISEDDRFALEHEDSDPPEWQKEHLEQIKPILDNFDSERYIYLPSKFEFHEYSVMERFIASLSNPMVQDSLWSAVKGNGAFRRFKNGIQRYGIRDQWYNYREATIKQFIIDWCERENIPYEDDTGK
jgi:hypothetical protein